MSHNQTCPPDPTKTKQKELISANAGRTTASKAREMGSIPIVSTSWRSLSVRARFIVLPYSCRFTKTNARRMLAELQIIISVSRVRIPSSHCDVAQSGRAGLFRPPLSPGHAPVAQWQSTRLLSGASWVRSLPGTPEIHAGGMPVGLHVDAALRGWRWKSSVLVQIQPSVLSGGGNRLAPPCPPDRKRKENPGECRRNYMAPTWIGRAGSTPLLACAQMANASAHSDAGRASRTVSSTLVAGT